MSQTIFEKCGGFASVRKIVSAFYEQVLDTPNLAGYFGDVEMRTLIEHQTQFISYILGGPYAVSDDVLRRAHASLKIQRSDFLEIVEILKETLEDHDLDDEDVEYVEREMLRREHLIVTQDKGGA